MESGVFGLHGKPAVHHVEEVLNREQEIVIALHQPMEEQLVLVQLQITKTVLLKHAQSVTIHSELQIIWQC